MSYATELAAISRTPVYLVVLTLDYCDEVFGAAPCAAVGSGDAKCFNTYPTCKDKANYNKITKDYRFSSADVPVNQTLLENVRPYVQSVTPLPTEITDNITVAGSVTIEFLDEPDTDIGIDPYYDGRTDPTRGTFWRKLLARNPNYRKRQVRIYQGFDNIDEVDYEQIFEGWIDNISHPQGGIVTVEANDWLAVLAEKEIPEEYDIKLVTDIESDSVNIPVTDETNLDPSGYIRMGDEIIYYASINGNTLEGCERGYFNTVAEEHSADEKILKVIYFAPQSGYDLIYDLLTTYAGIDAAYIDATSFTTAKDFDCYSVLFSAIIDERIDVWTLVFELVDLLSCKMWQGEDLKITIAKNLPNNPIRSYRSLTDADNIIIDSDSIDQRGDSRYSKVTMYWDKMACTSDEEMANYRRNNTVEDGDGNSANYYGETVEKAIWCRWLRPDYMDEEKVTRFIDNLLKRILRLGKHPMPTMNMELELKDSGIKTGEYVRISTDQIVDPLGASISNHCFQIVRREQRDTQFTYKALKYPLNKIAFMCATTVPEYSSASIDQKEYGFQCNTALTFADGTTSIYFTY